MNNLLILKGKCLDKIWGSDYCFKNGFSSSKNVGEYWSLSAINGNESIITNGKYKGLTLLELFNKNPKLFGLQEYKEFPILIKLIATSDLLSIQVHPDDKYALKNEKSLGKEEAWLILKSNKKSKLVIGSDLKNKTELKKMIKEKTYSKHLNSIHPVFGDYFYIPSKTIHAIGKDIVLLEVQQSSDITYRLYDYDRPDKNGKLRDLHIKQSIDCVGYGNYKYGGININNLKSNWNNAKNFDVYFENIKNEKIIESFDVFKAVTIIKGDIIVNKHKFKVGESFIIPVGNKIKITGNGKVLVSYPKKEK